MYTQETFKRNSLTTLRSAVLIVGVGYPLFGACAPDLALTWVGPPAFVLAAAGLYFGINEDAYRRLRFGLTLTRQYIRGRIG
jgi:hypothetical protein